MRILMKYLSPYKRRIFVGLTIKIIGTLLELMLPVLLTYMLEDVIVEERITPIVVIGSVMIVFSILACVMNVVANRNAAWISSEMSWQMRSDLFEKTLYLSTRSTDKFTIPSLESRITSDTYNIHNFINMAQRLGVRAPILLLGGVAITLVLDTDLALAMIATLPLIFVVVFFISRYGIPLYSRVQRSVDGMVRVVREDTQGIRVIKALSKNEYENKRFDGHNEKLSRDERKAGIIMGIPNPVMTLLMNFGICAVVAISAIRASKDGSSAATVIAFMQYFTLISMAMMSMSRMFVMATKCIASANRVGEVLDEQSELEVVSFDGEKGDTGAYISFENVSFSYLGKRNNLENVNINLPKGGSLGIIGATGSGKSTLVKLLMRFYDVGTGTVSIGGRSVNSYTREELSSLFGVVFQNDFIFADTVYENISFARDIPEDEVRRAAKIAQAAEFIEALPDGYSHVLAPGGTNLSGGQRQRLLVARALAARPPILVLDDSSSALDYKTDANLRRALKEELSGTTVITVAQRVSSVMSSDVILVLEDGKIIGSGTHEELLISCPEYKEISDSQMGGAIIE